MIWKNHAKNALASENASSRNEEDDIIEPEAPVRGRPSAVIKNLDLAVDIPGLPTKDDWSIFFSFLANRLFESL